MSESYTAIYMTIWSLGVINIILSKLRLKKINPDLHDKLFGRTILEMSPSHSIQFLKFTFDPRKWQTLDMTTKRYLFANIIFMTSFTVTFFMMFFI